MRTPLTPPNASRRHDVPREQVSVFQTLQFGGFLHFGNLRKVSPGAAAAAANEEHSGIDRTGFLILANSIHFQKYVNWIVFFLPLAKGPSLEKSLGTIAPLFANLSLIALPVTRPRLNRPLFGSYPKRLWPLLAGGWTCPKSELGPAKLPKKKHH